MRPAVTVPPFSMLRFYPKRYSGVLVLPNVVPFWISICFKYAPAPLMIISPTPERVLQKLRYPLLLSPSLPTRVTCVGSAASKRAKLPTGADIVVTNCICSALTDVNNSIQAEISVIFFIFFPCINGPNGLLYAFLYSDYIRIYPVLIFKILAKKKKTETTLLKGITENQQQTTDFRTLRAAKHSGMTKKKQ